MFLILPIYTSLLVPQIQHIVITYAILILFPSANCLVSLTELLFRQWFKFYMGSDPQVFPTITPVIDRICKLHFAYMTIAMYTPM